MTTTPTVPEAAPSAAPSRPRSPSRPNQHGRRERQPLPPAQAVRPDWWQPDPATTPQGPPAPPGEPWIESRLGPIMEERRLRLASLARLAGVSRASIRRLARNDVVFIDLGFLARLCAALDVG